MAPTLLGYRKDRKRPLCIRRPFFKPNLVIRYKLENLEGARLKPRYNNRSYCLVEFKLWPDPWW